MKQVVLEMPDNFDLDAAEVKALLAEKLYTEGEASIGKAVEISGMSYLAFVQRLGAKKISIFNYSPEDLRNDLAQYYNSR